MTLHQNALMTASVQWFERTLDDSYVFLSLFHFHNWGPTFCNYSRSLSRLLLVNLQRKQACHASRGLPHDGHRTQDTAKCVRRTSGVPKSDRKTYLAGAAVHGHREHNHGYCQKRRGQTRGARKDQGKHDKSPYIYISHTEGGRDFSYISLFFALHNACIFAGVISPSGAPGQTTRTRERPDRPDPLGPLLRPHKARPSTLAGPPELCRAGAGAGRQVPRAVGQSCAPRRR
jgi:hypothetical protein